MFFRVAIHLFMNKRNDSVLPNPYSVIEIEFWISKFVFGDLKI